MNVRRIEGMLRVLERCGVRAALFEAIIAVRPDVEVTALTLDPERGPFDQEITRFNLFAITGMAAR